MSKQFVKLRMKYYYPDTTLIQGVVGSALAAQLDARPPGDQEVAGSTPAESATFFRRDLIMKYFLRSFSPLS